MPTRYDARCGGSSRGRTRRPRSARPSSCYPPISVSASAHHTGQCDAAPAVGDDQHLLVERAFLAVEGRQLSRPALRGAPRCGPRRPSGGRRSGSGCPVSSITRFEMSTTLLIDRSAADLEPSDDPRGRGLDRDATNDRRRERSAQSSSWHRSRRRPRCRDRRPPYASGRPARMRIRVPRPKAAESSRASDTAVAQAVGPVRPGIDLELRRHLPIGVTAVDGQAARRSAPPPRSPDVVLERGKARAAS